MLDGGYYAIIGFNFQYDHTVQKILDQKNENEIIEIEQVEYISDSNYSKKTIISVSFIFNKEGVLI